MTEEKKKSITKRLREWANARAPLQRIHEDYGVDAIDELFMFLADGIEAEQRVIIEAQSDRSALIMAAYAKHISKPMEEGETITEWLARYYQELPCYPDGEPLSRGCVVYEGVVDGWCIWDDGEWELRDEEGTIIANGDQGESVKRPTSLALDADGVETKVGDTVYLAPENEENCGKYAKQLDCNAGLGGVAYGKPYKVSRIYDAGDCICADLAQTPDAWCPVSWLTHREPDSLEKLRDDIMEAVGELEETPYKGTHDRLLMMTERITALIERG